MNGRDGTGRPASGRVTRLSRRSVLIGVCGAGALGVLTVFWILATLFQSPAQQEANARPPSPGPILATVERGTVSEDTTFTGMIGPSSRREVALQPVSGDALSVVTAKPVGSGSAVSSGEILTEVNGHPVLLAQSSFAFYRDMGFGDRGPDVLALQTVLSEQGYDVVPDGVFGAGTADGVARWHADRGYVAPVRPRPEERPLTDSAEGLPGTTPSAPPPVEEEAYMPVSGLVAMPWPTAQVLRGVAVGTFVAAGRADLELGAPDVVVTVTTTPAEQGGIVPGDVATISIAGKEVEATVGEIRGAAGGSEGDAEPEPRPDGRGEETAEDPGPQVTLTITPNTALPPTVPVGSARVVVTRMLLAEEALLVPVSAVADRGGGRAAVFRHEEDGSFREVPVDVIVTHRGQVALAPRDADALREGEDVRVG